MQHQHHLPGANMGLDKAHPHSPKPIVCIAMASEVKPRGPKLFICAAPRTFLRNKRRKKKKEA